MNNAILINSNDSVGVALKDLHKGETALGVVLLNDITLGHKFAIKDIKSGEDIIKYGFPIGHAICDIKAGEHVHTNNIKTNLGSENEYVYSPKIPCQSPSKSKIMVKVFERKFNRYGIRNNLMIVPLVGCVNEQAEAIKVGFLKSIDPSLIDEVMVAKHPYGCSQLGGDLENTIKILSAIVKHPNNGGVLVLSLGCENNQIEHFKEQLGDYDASRVMFLKAQDVKDEVKEGIKLCKSLYKKMIKDSRVERDLSIIKIGLKCGGSDGLSGITANPLIGRISDFVIDNGGSAVLSEVPEMFGAEQILMNRSDSTKTFDKIVHLINGFKEYYADHHQVCYENPSPGNKEGGITTLEDKSLGCVQKAGTREVKDVLFGGDFVKISGLNLLNGPGNDLIASTNIACSGCQLILFSTGRGTPFGTFVPTIKISTNSALFNKKRNWIDFNSGRIVDGVDKDRVYKDLIKFLVKIINGETKSKNEINKFNEIAIFKDGVTL